MDNKIVNKEHQKLIDFLIYSEKLKTEPRHAHKSDGQYESAAEHSWRLSLMLMMIAPKLQKKPDLLKAIKIATIHDLAEIDFRDIPILEHIDDNNQKDFKDIEEKIAIENVRKKLGNDGDEILELWYEYLEAKTYEAKIVRVLNMIEGQMQFLSEDVKKFSHDEQSLVAKLIAKTAELSRIDPYIEGLYFSCGDLFKERTKLQ